MRGNHILVYHRVVPDDCSAAMVGLLSGELVTQKSFAEQMKWLRKRYRMVSLETLIQRRDESTGLAAVTFDDGMADNLEHALPVLDELVIPASIFVIYGSIGVKRGFEHHRVARLIGEGKCQMVQRIASEFTKPRDQLKAVMSELTAKPTGELATVFDELYGDNEDDRFLDESEIVDLAKAGIDIQSHSVSHRRLATLTGEDLENELTESRIGLMKLLGKEVRYFAYPVGRSKDFNQDSVNAVKSAGYSAAFTTETGVVDEASDLWRLPRIGTRNSVQRLRKKLHAGRFWF